MNRIRFLFSKTLVSYLLHELWIRYYFKFVMPKVHRITVDGIELDVSSLGVKERNRIMRGLYETHEKNMCLAHLTPADSVMEIGGAIGFIGLVCQKKVGIKRYVTFEANPRTIETLKRNYELNGCQPNVRNCALAAEDGQIELEVGSDFWDNSVVKAPAPSGRKTITVPAASFESLLRDLPHRVNVLIIDIEGAEQFIDFSRLPDGIDKIIIEVHPQWIGVQRKYQIFSDLFQAGFRVADQEDETFVFLRDLPKAEPKLLDFEGVIDASESEPAFAGVAGKNGRAAHPNFCGANP